MACTELDIGSGFVFPDNERVAPFTRIRRDVSVPHYQAQTLEARSWEPYASASLSLIDSEGNAVGIATWRQAQHSGDGRPPGKGAGWRAGCAIRSAY